MRKQCLRAARRHGVHQDRGFRQLLGNVLQRRCISRINQRSKVAIGLLPRLCAEPKSGEQHRSLFNEVVAGAHNEAMESTDVDRMCALISCSARSSSSVKVLTPQQCRIELCGRHQALVIDKEGEVKATPVCLEGGYRGWPFGCLPCHWWAAALIRDSEMLLNSLHPSEQVREQLARGRNSLPGGDRFKIASKVLRRNPVCSVGDLG